MEEEYRVPAEMEGVTVGTGVVTGWTVEIEEATAGITVEM